MNTQKLNKDKNSRQQPYTGKHQNQTPQQHRQSQMMPSQSGNQADLTPVQHNAMAPVPQRRSNSLSAPQRSTQSRSPLEQIAAERQQNNMPSHNPNHQPPATFLPTIPAISFCSLPFRGTFGTGCPPSTHHRRTTRSVRGELSIGVGEWRVFMPRVQNYVS